MTVLGEVQEVIEGESMMFRLHDWTGALIRSDVVDIFDNGTFQYQFPIAGTIRLTGEYQVIVNYGGEQAESLFSVTSGSVDGAVPWVLIIDGQEHRLHYRLLGGSIRNIVADVERRSIIITMIATDDRGNLKLELPKSVILAQDSSTDQDMPFSVSIDGTPANFTELSYGGGSRALEIPFDATVSEIVISGTWLVPEFSQVVLFLFVSASGIGILFRAISVRKL